MPPMRGVKGQMIVSFFTSSGGPALNANADWNAMGKWYANLVGERVDASAEIKQQVAALTASKTTSLEKMEAIAEFVQHDIRYVAIELGIGGIQPHSASDVFSHACFFLHVIGHPPYTIEVGFPRIPVKTISRRIAFSRLQPFHYVQAPKFARVPDRSHRYDLSS